jgi:hypothetical protein
LIGKDLLKGRNRGPCFAGHVDGADGFRSALRDDGNQIQHAMAGIYIGYRYGWLGCAYVKWREHELQDDRLYDATCPLGRKLTDENYKDLARNLRKAIGDDTCRGEE